MMLFPFDLSYGFIGRQGTIKPSYCCSAELSVDFLHDNVDKFC